MLPLKSFLHSSSESLIHQSDTLIGNVPNININRIFDDYAARQKFLLTNFIESKLHELPLQIDIFKGGRCLDRDADGVSQIVHHNLKLEKAFFLETKGVIVTCDDYLICGQAEVGN